MKCSRDRGRTWQPEQVLYDEGATWSHGRTVWPHPSSYSDMAVLDDITIGIVYERGNRGSKRYWNEVRFARFDLDWLTDGQDGLD